VWVLGACVALSALAFVAVCATSAVLARHRAQAAADLGALAAAELTATGASAACPAAARVVALNGGRITDCEVDGLDVVVAVEVRVAGAPPGIGPARATARAGPIMSPGDADVGGHPPDDSPGPGEGGARVGPRRRTTTSPAIDRRAHRREPRTSSHAGDVAHGWTTRDAVQLPPDSAESPPADCAESRSADWADSLESPPGLAACRTVRNASSTASSTRTASGFDSGSLPLPHFGDCTHDGQPRSQPHDEIASRVARSHSAAT
jgi:secretion/DNA translocation related TadE-like protein